MDNGIKLEKNFSEVYTKFKLNYYKSVFSNFADREASLTTVETYCVEVIYALNKPTVNEFALFLGISAPNAAYKVNRLVQKGYIKKVQSDEDKREYRLCVTEKFYNYYNIGLSYIWQVSQRIIKNCSDSEITELNSILERISHEFMPELPEINLDEYGYDE